NKVVQDWKPFAVIGPSCNDTAQRLVQPFNDAKIITISPSATDASLTDPASHQPYFFRTAPDDLNEGSVAAQSARDFLGANSAAILYGAETDFGFDFYSVRLQEAFAKKFTELGGTVVAQIQT